MTKLLDTCPKVWSWSPTLNAEQSAVYWSAGILPAMAGFGSESAFKWAIAEAGKMPALQ
jgi:hypothetical protein